MFKIFGDISDVAIAKDSGLHLRLFRFTMVKDLDFKLLRLDS